MQERTMKNSGLVSIIAPSYNAEKYLDRSITSVFNQTYPYWELLIVDDGSDDNSVSICRSYAKIRKRASGR